MLPISRHCCRLNSGYWKSLLKPSYKKTYCCCTALAIRGPQAQLATAYTDIQSGLMAHHIETLCPGRVPVLPNTCCWYGVWRQVTYRYFDCNSSAVKLSHKLGKIPRSVSGQLHCDWGRHGGCRPQWWQYSTHRRVSTGCRIMLILRRLASSSRRYCCSAIIVTSCSRPVKFARPLQAIRITEALSTGAMAASATSAAALLSLR